MLITQGFLASQTTAGLADLYFCENEMRDPLVESESPGLITLRAKIVRRGLDFEDLGAAWKALTVDEALESRIFSVGELAARYGAPKDGE